MTAIAVLFGNMSYQNLAKLECCEADLAAMRELLEATQKYETIEVILDTTADEMRERIRAALTKDVPIEEIFFYFTGHGVQQEDDFYYCGTNFDKRRPNDTGVSTDALHQLLKLANAELVVKVIDACNSGTLLVKDGAGFSASAKHGFRDLVQISSCLDSQNALVGNPLSVFTDFFRRAVLRKKEGVIYYTDIIGTLRDEFLNNQSQTPYFVSQSDAREVFVENASLLDELRKKLAQPNESRDINALIPAPPPKPTLLQTLELAEARIVTPEKLQYFNSNFFDQLIGAIHDRGIYQYFTTVIVELSSFEELTAKPFVVRVLARQKRPDNFVTAVVRNSKRANPLSSILGIANQLSLYGLDDEISETWDLHLNCRVDRTQVRITLIPKFMTLKKIVLVVTCAPSLENCYIFEVATQHARRSFNEFETDGTELSTRWWQVSWTENTTGIVSQITDKLREAVEAHVQAVSERLSNQDE